MVYILCGNPDRSYFRGKEAKELKEHFRMKKSDLSKIKGYLVDKGFVKETGVVRGDALIVDSLRKFQKYVKVALQKGLLPPIVFNLSFNITHGDNTEQEGRNNKHVRRGEPIREASGVHSEQLLELSKVSSS